MTSSIARNPHPAAGRVRARALPALAVVGAVLLLAACGGHGGGHYDPYDPYVPAYGGVGVDNQSFEYVEGFYLALAGTGLFTGDLLSAPLPPLESEWVGDFEEDLYDAEADLEFGDLVQWFDVYVPGGDTTWFEVY